MKLVTYFNDDEIKINCVQLPDGRIAITAQQATADDVNTLALISKKGYRELTLEVVEHTEGLRIGKITRLKKEAVGTDPLNPQ